MKHIFPLLLIGLLAIPFNLEAQRRNPQAEVCNLRCPNKLNGFAIRRVPVKNSILAKLEGNIPLA